MPSVTRVARTGAWVCVFMLMVVALDARGAESWLGVSAGAEISHYTPMGVLSLEGGLWPEHKHFGYQAYFEHANPHCDTAIRTIGAEPIFRLHRFYAGIGLAYSNKKLCQGKLDTNWNFSVGVGVRITDRVDIQWRHRSHGADLGIDRNRSNLGVNLIEVRVRFYNK